eukprot:UC4_evm3s1289
MSFFILVFSHSCFTTTYDFGIDPVYDKIALRDDPIGLPPGSIRYLDSSSRNKWKAVDSTGKFIITDAQVPGDLVSDLNYSGFILDPIFNNNFRNSTLWGDGTIWTYSTTFNTSTNDLSSDVLLVFDGIKMGANISLDGRFLGQSNDQFLRYVFHLDVLEPGPHALEVRFSDEIYCDGRWMGCSGGWDWAPYTGVSQEGASVFTRGIWKSVYLANLDKASVGITHIVPQVYYLGGHPVEPLTSDTTGDFTVNVTIHLLAPNAIKSVIKVKTDWGVEKSVLVDLSEGESAVSITLSAESSKIKLWWPVKLGKQNLHNISVSVGQSSASRMIGFRHFAVVTGNDTDSSYVKKNKNADGTDILGMLWRVNGAVVLARGSNIIPMEELEGWYSAQSHLAMIRGAIDANYNSLRIWGGGIYLPQIFYDECDRLGLMLYHDLMFAQNGHAPRKTTTQRLELRHNARRLSHHPSVCIYDGCNECSVHMSDPKTAIYATFVLTTLVEEDNSKSILPSCPSAGWLSGVNKLNAKPNGNPLISRDAPYGLIETHRPKWHGGGFPAMNGDPTLNPKPLPGPGGNQNGLFPSNVPLHFVRVPKGPQFNNTFSSESPGVSVFSSFESMSATIDSKRWGIHGNSPWDTCDGNTFRKNCRGDNIMAQRNYPCDNIIIVYFGSSHLNASGEQSFKEQLWKCMIAQAIVMKQNIELTRASNRFGILTWQHNEIWPTGLVLLPYSIFMNALILTLVITLLSTYFKGGWGGVEYGNFRVPGQVIGGRWKPLQYFLKSSLYKDVLASCDDTGLCYVVNDFPLAPFSGNFILKATSFENSTSIILFSSRVSLPRGAGAIEWFQTPLASIDKINYAVEAIVTNERGETVVNNFIMLSTPENMKLRQSNVKVSALQDPKGNITAIVSCSEVAVFVTLTTLAHGRFTDNIFLMTPGERKVGFIPAQPSPHKSEQELLNVFTNSLRVEDISSYRSM